MGILEKYGRICIESWNKDPMTKEISDAIQNIMQNVKSRQIELENMPSPYKECLQEKYLMLVSRDLFRKF